MKHKKGQAALEYISTYSWAFLILLGVISALYYFDFFEVSRYQAQNCVFDSNLYCHDFTVQTRGEYYDVRVLLQNNMDEDIDVNTVKIYEKDGSEIVCNTTKIYCSYKDNTTYGFANPSNSGLILDVDNPWIPTRVCLLDIEHCPGISNEDFKKKINFEINFKGSRGSINHTATGTLYSNINKFTNVSQMTTDVCDLSNFDPNHKLTIQTASANDLFMIDGNGMVLISGAVIENWHSGWQNDDFKIQDSSGSVLAWISNPEGNLYLQGTLNEQSTQEPDPLAKEFIIRNNVGGTAGFFDDNGNFYIKRCVKNIV